MSESSSVGLANIYRNTWGEPMHLVTVGNATLDQPAAVAYAQALMAGAPRGVTSSYRSPSEQNMLRQGWLDHLPGYNFALPPSQSVHCLGLAIDFPLDAELWFRDHPQYGFVFISAPGQSEHWHAEFRGLPNSERHEDMIELIRSLYRYYCGREAADSELIMQSDATSAMTAIEIHNAFIGGVAPPECIVTAYRTFLHRDPSQAEIDQRTALAQTIAVVFHDVANSPEAKA